MSKPSPLCVVSLALSIGIIAYSRSTPQEATPQDPAAQVAQCWDEAHALEAQLIEDRHELARLELEFTTARRIGVGGYELDRLRPPIHAQRELIEEHRRQLELFQAEFRQFRAVLGDGQVRKALDEQPQ